MLFWSWDGCLLDRGDFVFIRVCYGRFGFGEVGRRSFLLGGVFEMV